MWVAVRAFVGVVDGKEVNYRTGDEIEDAAAQAMALARKPELARKVSK